MGRIHEDHATSPVHPGVSQHESGSSQSAQPGDRVRMDATPGGSPGSSSPVAGDHDLFATSLTARFPVFFAPAWEPKAAGVDAFLQPWDTSRHMPSLPMPS